MNPLNDILPAGARKIVYAVFVIAGIVIGALNVAGLDVGTALDVMAYLTIPVGALAVSNTAVSKAEPAAFNGDGNERLDTYYADQDDWLDEDDYEGEAASAAEVEQGYKNTREPLPGPETGSQSL